MSAVVLWRCADCATADEVSAPQPSRALADYLPQDWTLSTASHGAVIVRCGDCSGAAEPSGRDDPESVSNLMLAGPPRAVADDGPRYDDDMNDDGPA